ncbi:MAG TPA: hypothetical protein VE439_04025 [Anaerolineae bacterium]|nr:hypothetical protein [Anaerolineae bacterium]
MSYLHKQGLEVFGIDRIAREIPYLIDANWLTFSFKPDCWGTIISHMAFSNHFIHHHLRVDGRPGDYAQKMIEVLRSLRLNGSLYYAPGLPFIESLLPSSKFSVYKRLINIGENQRSSQYPVDINKVLYLTKVLRIA